MYISKLEIYIFRLDFYISKLEMKFSGDLGKISPQGESFSRTGSNKLQNL